MSESEAGGRVERGERLQEEQRYTGKGEREKEMEMES